MKKAFTLIELIATIVILGVVTSIVSILIMNVIRNVKDSARKRSIDNYGRIIETSMAEYQSQNLKYPDSIEQLEIEYVGSVIECETRRINPDKTIYLSECKVNGKKVLDKSTEDGYYHYGTLVLTNEEYVDKLGKNIEIALKDYYEENNKYPINYRLLNLPTLDKDVNCVSEINYDGSIYLHNCSVDGKKVIDYTYGEIVYPIATQFLLSKVNSKGITNYTDGDIHEMYTFDHESTIQTPALTDYRYIGSDPNNYVEFNNELWRIIGVFKVEDENGNWETRMKIVKNESINSMVWDSSNTAEWKATIINYYLNNEYYQSLNDQYKNLIASSTYYLGGRSTSATNAKNYYIFERSEEVYNNADTKWIGNFGLMYPSDYAYTFSLGVDDNCYSNTYKCEESNNGVPTESWIYNSNANQSTWLISPRSNIETGIYLVYDKGIVNGGSKRYSKYVRPVAYLKSNVKVISGDGTIDNAYKLSL